MEMKNKKDIVNHVVEDWNLQYPKYSVNIKTNDKDDIIVTQKNRKNAYFLITILNEEYYKNALGIPCIEILNRINIYNPKEEVSESSYYLYVQAMIKRMFHKEKRLDELCISKEPYQMSLPI